MESTKCAKPTKGALKDAKVYGCSRTVQSVFFCLHAKCMVT